MKEVLKLAQPSTEILRVTPEGEFIWHENADRLIDEGDFTNSPSMQHILRALRKPLAQPEQEPNDLTIAYMAGFSRGKDLAPQRTWVGLTNEEFIYFCSYVRSDVLSEIEAKLKELNT